jgi:DNA-binding beta-propeller fold protein YncE
MDVSVSPDGLSVYAVGRDDNAIARLDRNPVDGTLTYRGRWKDGVSSIDGLGGASGVLVSPDGNYVYTAGYTDMAVAVFARSSSNSWIEQTQVINRNTPSPLLDGANDIDVSPDGSSVYIAMMLSCICILLILFPF